MKEFFKHLLGKQQGHPPPVKQSEPKKDHGKIQESVSPLRVGDNVEVHYLDFGLPQIEIARVSALPGEDAFYLTFDGTEMHITYWHVEHSDGRVSGVKMIKSGDRVLYENKRIPFDYEYARMKGPRTSADGPVRLMTREYLNGQFG